VPYNRHSANLDTAIGFGFLSFFTKVHSMSSREKSRFKSYLLSNGLILSLGGFLLLSAMPAMAQDEPKQEKPAQEKSSDTDKKSESTETTTVTVTAQKQGNRIDRQVYDVKGDIDSSQGSASDALNKVPAVNVDADGNVTLRGNTNVQVRIDGRQSALTNQDNRAATLQGLSGGDIESIEVINNPSAAFGSDGGAGIINIVLRRNRPPGTSGSFIGNVSQSDRYNMASSVAHNRGRLTLTGAANVRIDGRGFDSESQRLRYDAGGALLSQTDQTGLGDGRRDSKSVTAGFDYNLGETDAFGLSVTLTESGNDSNLFERTTLKGSTSSLIEDYQRRSTTIAPRDDFQWRARFDHKAKENGETLKFDARYSLTRGDRETRFDNVYTIGGAGRSVLDIQTVHNETNQMVFSGDYGRNFGKGAFNSGFEVESNANETSNRYRSTDQGTGQLVDNAAFSNEFALTTTEHEAYFTYQTPLSEKWSLMGGLRYEHTRFDINQRTTAQEVSRSFGLTYPSLHATFNQSPTTKWRFSAVRRSQKPSNSDLNPFVVYRDAFNVASGNTDLTPELTTSLEVGYEYNKSGINMALRAYGRQTDDVIIESSRFLSSSVLLTTKENAGENKSLGLELTLGGRVHKAVMVNLYANLSQNELQSVVNSVPLTRSDTALSLRGRIDAGFSKKDRVQLVLGSSGRRLTGQGYIEPMIFSNLSYRRQVTPKFALVASVNDPFDLMRMKQVIDTPSLKSVVDRDIEGRAFYFGFAYTFGGAKAPEGWQGRPGGRGQEGPPGMPRPIGG
jgi:hypothetical protein